MRWGLNNETKKRRSGGGCVGESEGGGGGEQHGFEGTVNDISGGEWVYKWGCGECWVTVVVGGRD